MTEAPALYVRQLPVGPMKNFAYLVGAEGAREVVVVDPAWDVDAIVQAAEAEGKQLTAAFVSHCHGDHINGLPDVLKRFDLPVYAQRLEAEFSAELSKSAGDALRPLAPGDTFEVGPLTAKALHTPGHTPGSQCLYAGGAIASGDTVFVNACGRCDLRGGNPEDMYRTITSVLMALPEGTALLPGHDYGDVPQSTLAREKANNPYFRAHDLAEFVAFRMRPRR